MGGGKKWSYERIGNIFPQYTVGGVSLRREEIAKSLERFQYRLVDLREHSPPACRFLPLSLLSRTNPFGIGRAFDLGILSCRTIVSEQMAEYGRSIVRMTVGLQPSYHGIDVAP